MKGFGSSRRITARESLWLQTKFTSLDGQDLGKKLPYAVQAPLDAQVGPSSPGPKRS